MARACDNFSVDALAFACVGAPEVRAAFGRLGSAKVPIRRRSVTPDPSIRCGDLDRSIGTLVSISVRSRFERQDRS